MPKDTNKCKILPAHQFHYTKETKGKKEDQAAFSKLLREINDNGEELVFIPVNNPNFH